MFVISNKDGKQEHACTNVNCANYSGTDLSNPKSSTNTK